jgi:endonuclease YncB( thermonuclease family)
MQKIIALLIATCCLQAVETKPVPVLKVIDGDTIEVTADLGGVQMPVRVRLQYVDTPEVHDNAHGQAMEEGKLAKAFLTELLPFGTLVTLHSGKERLEFDGNGRILAIVGFLRDTDGSPRKIAPPDDQPRTSSIHCANAEIISAGWSPYWMKYGLAPDSYDGQFRLAQDQADKAGAGIWSSNPQWMTDKANERTAPKKDKAEKAKGQTDTETPADDVPSILEATRQRNKELQKLAEDARAEAAKLGAELKELDDMKVPDDEKL